jgi:hypothetical protein
LNPSFPNILGCALFESTQLAPKPHHFPRKKIAKVPGVILLVFTTNRMAPFFISRQLKKGTGPSMTEKTLPFKKGTTHITTKTTSPAASQTGSQLGFFHFPKKGTSRRKADPSIKGRCFVNRQSTGPFCISEEKREEQPKWRSK